MAKVDFNAMSVYQRRTHALIKDLEYLQEHRDWVQKDQSCPNGDNYKDKEFLDKMHLEELELEGVILTYPPSIREGWVVLGKCIYTGRLRLDMGERFDRYHNASYYHLRHW